MSVIPEVAPSYRRLFSIEGFPRLVSGMLLARTSNTMVSLVLVLFALERFHSATIAGLVAFLSLAPGLVLSPIAGALLDRHGRTRLMVFDYCVAAACLALIVVLGATNVITEALLLAIVTVMSLTFPLSTTGVRTLFPVLVPLPLGGDAAPVGQLFTLQGLTAAVSVLLVGRFGTAGRERELMAGSILLQSLGYLIALLAPDLLIVGVAMLVLGIATGPFDVVLFTMRQR